MRGIESFKIILYLFPLFRMALNLVHRCNVRRAIGDIWGSWR